MPVSRSMSRIASSSSRSLPGVRRTTATRRPSSDTSSAGSIANSRRACGVRSTRLPPAASQAMTCVQGRSPFSCSHASQWRTGCALKRRALGPCFARSDTASRCFSCATPSSTGAKYTNRSARRAKRNASTPSGSSVSWRGSPPSAGSSHTCMRFSASSSGLTSFGWRLERKPRAPSWRKHGALSLESPRVSCTAGPPSVGSFHKSLTYFAPSRSSRSTLTASHVPSGDAAIAPTRLRAICCSTV